MIDILQFLPPRTRKSPSGWFTFSGPCCVHNGESRDTRKRGGLIFDNDDWSFHCFNCGFKTRFVNGQSISLKTQKFMSWLGIDKLTIQKMNLDSIKNKKIYDIATDRTTKHDQIEQQNIFFDKIDLPKGAIPITSANQWAIDYIAARGLNYRDYGFRITPEAQFRAKNRIIIPYKYAGDIVGWTSRYTDQNFPKYKNEHQQPGYVFGIDMQQNDWDYLIVTEGIFDAISIRGAAVLHNEISDQQMSILRRQGKEVIIVPDQDKAGLGLAEQAIEAGFSISVPEWDDDVKDVNDAVKEYGRLGTLLSIITNKTSSKIRAKVALTNLRTRKKIVDRIHI